MNNFEVKYTVRIYEPATVLNLAAQYEREQPTFKTKNEFLTHIITLGLDALDAKSRPPKPPKEEKEDIYALLVKIFDYISVQFKTVHIKENLLEHLLCSTYNIVFALNSGDSLFPEKIESGFYDDIPERCKAIVADLMKRYGLSDKK